MEDSCPICHLLYEDNSLRRPIRPHICGNALCVLCHVNIARKYKRCPFDNMTYNPALVTLCNTLTFRQGTCFKHGGAEVAYCENHKIYLCHICTNDHPKCVINLDN